MNLNIPNFADLSYVGEYQPIKYLSKGGVDYWIAISDRVLDAQGRDFLSPMRKPYSGNNAAILNSIDWENIPFRAPQAYTGGVEVGTALRDACLNIGVPDGNYFTYRIMDTSTRTYMSKFLSVPSDGSCNVTEKSAPYNARARYRHIIFGKIDNSQYPNEPVIYTSDFGAGATDTSGACYADGVNLLDDKSGYIGNKKIILLDVDDKNATIGTWLPESKGYYEHLSDLEAINRGDVGYDAFTLGLRDYDIEWNFLSENDLDTLYADYIDSFKAKNNFTNDDLYTDPTNNVALAKTWVDSGTQMNVSTIPQVKYTSEIYFESYLGSGVIPPFQRTNGITSKFPAFITAKVPLKEIGKHYKLCSATGTMTELSGYIYTQTMNVCQLGEMTWGTGNATAFLLYDLKKMFIVGNQQMDIERLKSLDINFTVGDPDIVSELQGKALTYYQGSDHEVGRNIKLVTQSDEVRTFAKLVSQRLNTSEPLPSSPLLLGTDSSNYIELKNSSYSEVPRQPLANPLFMVDVSLSGLNTLEAERELEYWLTSIDYNTASGFGEGGYGFGCEGVPFEDQKVGSGVQEEPIAEEPVVEEPVVEQPTQDVPTAQQGVDVDYTTTQSNYNDIDSLLNEYIDAANYAADELADCNTKIKEYKELCKLDPNNADACESVTELEEYIKELQAELDNLSSQSGALEAFKGLIATRLSSTYGLNISQDSTNEQIVSAIETKLEGLKSDLASKTKEYNDKVAEYDLLVAEESKLAQELEDALADDAADDAEIAKLKDDIADLEAANLALSGGETELNDLVAELQLKVANLENQLNNSVDRLQFDQVKQQLEDSKELVTKLNGYKDRLFAIVAGYQEVTKSINGTVLPSDYLTMNIGAVYGLANTLKNELMTELAKVGTSQADVSDLQSQVGSLTLDKEDLQNQLNDLQTQYDALRLEHQNATANTLINLQNKDAQIAAQEAELDRLEAEIQSLESQLATADTTISSKDTEIADLSDSKSELTSEVSSLNAQLESVKNQLNDSLEAYKTDKTNELNAEIDSLVSEGVLSQGYALGLENLISDWSDANTEISRLEGELNNLSESIESGSISEQSLLADKNKLNAELATANATINNQNEQLEDLIDDIESANSEIEQFNLFENKLQTALNNLESKLTPLGYQKVVSFNGDNGFNPFGSNPTEFQKLMFRGMKMRKAYLNMSGNKYHSHSNFASKGDSAVAPIVKLGLFAGLIYVASKFLKK